MKKLKYILSSIILALVLISPAFAFVGCTKHYKVTISIASGYGDVTTVNQLTHVKKSLVGTNDVEAGSKFEFSVVPLNEKNKYYVIDYIKIDGVLLEEGVDYTISGLNVDKTYGIARPLLSENIQENHTIEVAFKEREYFLCSYEYFDSEENVYKPVLNDDGSIYTKQSTSENNYMFNIVGYYGFGMQYIDPTTSTENNPVYTDVANSDEMHIPKDTRFHTEKSESELKTFLGL